MRHHRRRRSPPTEAPVVTSLGAYWLSAASLISAAMWLIVQAKMSKRYTCHYSSTALMSVMGSVQSVAFALCIERDWSQWRLGWNIKLFTAAYTGTVCSGLVVVVISWCIRKRGPLFVSVFSPFSLVIVGVASSLLLNERISIGSVFGRILIVFGLYMVLWGKSKEMKTINNVNSEQEQHGASSTVP